MATGMEASAQQKRRVTFDEVVAFVGFADMIAGLIMTQFPETIPPRFVDLMIIAGLVVVLIAFARIVMRLAFPEPLKVSDTEGRSRRASDIQDGPTDWLVNQAISWIAVGEPTSSGDWKKRTQEFFKHSMENDGALRPPPWEEGLVSAERLLLEALRKNQIEAYGKLKDSVAYKLIRTDHLKSDVRFHLYDDSLVRDYSKDRRVFPKWDLPDYFDVKLNRESVLKLWPDGGLFSA